tara:strand:- start:509 stop:1732 length:1224 start_codon:yes stop_codon:yes gene_type:complete
VFVWWEIWLFVAVNQYLAEVQEVQGLYGPLGITERMLQRIWKQKDFTESRLRTLEGQPIRVLRSGSWNHREGPDFLDASLEINGQPVRGDVEIHFRSRDWRRHGHQLDANFSSVALHVVVFPPTPGEAMAETSKGVLLPTCSLLEAMDCSLEEYAELEVLRNLSGRNASDFSRTFLALPLEIREARLKSFARERWGAKVAWATSRLFKATWEELCHQLFLEVLGHPRNRAVMSSIALAHPLPQWRDKLLDPDQLFASRQERWKLAGTRPQNHPRLRLRQYLGLFASRPDWALLAREFGFSLPSGGECEQTSLFRKQRLMPEKKDCLINEVLGGAIPGGSAHTWMVDGLLPLVTAESGKDLFAWWFHWFAGNAPALLGTSLRGIGVIGKPTAPLCNGWIQGALGSVTQ